MSERVLRVLLSGIVLVPLLAVTLWPLATGGARFPTRDECVRPATTEGDDLEVVYGRFVDPRQADRRLAEVTAVGFVGAERQLDACGRWKVSYDAIETLEVGEALAAQVREAGLDATVEHEG